MRRPIVLLPFAFCALALACGDQPADDGAGQARPSPAAQTAASEPKPQPTASPEPTAAPPPAPAGPAFAGISCRLGPFAVPPVALGEPFCAVWVDSFDDETGFRVVARLSGSKLATNELTSEESSYLVPADTVEIVFPPDRAPVAAPIARCVEQQSISIEVFVLRRGGEEPVGSYAISRECGR